LLIEPISRAHDRKAFDLVVSEVTHLLREQVAPESQEEPGPHDGARRRGRRPRARRRYHTLVMAQVRQEEIPGDRPRIKRDIPVILLGQLGVDPGFQGKGLGETLLMDAQARVDEVSKRAGVRAMMLDARNERLARW